jgi:hypothetical protein
MEMCADDFTYFWDCSVDHLPQFLPTEDQYYRVSMQLLCAGFLLSAHELFFRLVSH